MLSSLRAMGLSALVGAATFGGAATASADPVECVGGEADELCEPSEPCTCDDCFSATSCGGCVDDGSCDVNDACTCPDCDTDPVCNNQGSCSDNGECNQFTESCACADCGEVPNCVDNPPSGEGGAGVGGSGEGGSSEDGGTPTPDTEDGSGGCLASGRERSGAGVFALLLGLAVVALRRRR